MWTTQWTGPCKGKKLQLATQQRDGEKFHHLPFLPPYCNTAEEQLKQGFPGVTSGKEPICQCRRQETQVQSLSQEDPLEEEVATHSSILA